MSKHIIVANLRHQAQRYYFLGYKDDGAVCETCWTRDPWRARWIDVSEATVELELLTNLCPSYSLSSWSLETIPGPNEG